MGTVIRIFHTKIHTEFSEGKTQREGKKENLTIDRECNINSIFYFISKVDSLGKGTVINYELCQCPRRSPQQWLQQLTACCELRNAQFTCEFTSGSIHIKAHSPVGAFLFPKCVPEEIPKLESHGQFPICGLFKTRCFPTYVATSPPGLWAT